MVQIQKKRETISVNCWWYSLQCTCVPLSSYYNEKWLCGGKVMRHKKFSPIAALGQVSTENRCAFFRPSFYLFCHAQNIGPMWGSHICSSACFVIVTWYCHVFMQYSLHIAMWLRLYLYVVRWLLTYYYCILQATCVQYWNTVHLQQMHLLLWCTLNAKCECIE